MNGVNEMGGGEGATTLTMDNINMDTIQDQINSLKHPKVVLFHLLFRSLAIVTYLLCSFFSDNFVLNFRF